MIVTLHTLLKLKQRDVLQNAHVFVEERKAPDIAVIRSCRAEREVGRLREGRRIQIAVPRRIKAIGELVHRRDTRHAIRPVAVPVFLGR